MTRNIIAGFLDVYRHVGKDSRFHFDTLYIYKVSIVEQSPVQLQIRLIPLRQVILDLKSPTLSGT
jgi:hypothetical protein